MKFAFKIIVAAIILTANDHRAAANVNDTDTVHRLQEVVVRPRTGIRKARGTAHSVDIISSAELKKAACCNLGESFTTNPSVDVSYNDAATGARQIRLLGLSGSYVQMLTENVPAFRGAAAPFGLGYIAGPWMQSIQVSKGASSVKNGFESISGQINVEMKKPQLDPSLSLNGYVDHLGKIELNADGNLHFGPNWSGGLLLHGENSFKAHDSNGDGFIDMPKVRQFTAMNRWAYMGSNYVFQAAVKGLAERRLSGQDEHQHSPESDNLYRIKIDTRRVEAFTKNAYIFDHENDGNVALILAGSYHSQDADYGMRYYNIDQSEIYASLMFERKWLEIHALSTGLSLMYDRFDQHWLTDIDQNPSVDSPHETVPGVYAQYTLNLDSRLIAMAGVRYDHSSVYGSMFTPRFHLRYNPDDSWSLNCSAGRGYRSPHPLAEYNYLLASSRRIIISDNLKQESAWNFGAGANFNTTIADRRFTAGAEYFYTDFRHQLCVNLDRDPHAVYFYDLAGRSHSHTLQLESTFEPIASFTVGLAYRLTDVRSDYGDGIMRLKPLTPRNKGLLTLSYSPMMGLWQFDATLSVNGGGRMPDPYVLADNTLSWKKYYKAYCGLNAQITRNFRHWAVYIGGENLTGYTQPTPIVDAANPWGSNFDATMIYGPLHGAVIYAGFRYNITRFL